jgi:hypothetical protein
MEKGLLGQPVVELDEQLFVEQNLLLPLGFVHRSS